MRVHEFTIIASGLHPDEDDLANRFFEAGCDDATLSFQKGVIIIEFDRESPSLSAAIMSAYSDVIKAGAKVERFEPDHLVSLADIAKRTGPCFVASHGSLEPEPPPFFRPDIERGNCA